MLLASIALYLLGEWAGYAVFRALAGPGLGAVLVALLLTARRPRVAVSRDVFPDRVERGRPALARLRVRNPSSRRQPGFTAQDAAGPGRQAVTVRALPPGGEATYHYELPTSRRGRFTVGPLVVERSDPLALAGWRMSTGEVAALWVHPRRYPVDAVVGGRPRHHHEGRAVDDSLRGSADLRDVRPYVVGDEVRHLHWKATARTGQLMVRDYADPHQPRLSLLLDTRSEALTAAAFEEAVDLAASVLCASAMAGHHSRLLTSSGTDLATAGGPLAARELLDVLCEVGQGPAAGCPLVPPVLSGGRSTGGGLVVVTGHSSSVSSVAGLQNRYSVLVVALGAASSVTDRPLVGQAPARSSGVPGVRVVAANGALDTIRQWATVVAR